MVSFPIDASTASPRTHLEFLRVDLPVKKIFFTVMAAVLAITFAAAASSNGESEYFYEGGLPYDRTANFERPFTPRTSLRSPRNFGNARFRRFANFDFLTPKKKNKIGKKF